MTETSELEFELTIRRAQREGFYVGRHAFYDPVRGTGDLYVMPRRTIEGERSERLLSYATSDQVHRFLNEQLIKAKKNELERRTG